jgi:hypothetical protein
VQAATAERPTAVRDLPVVAGGERVSHATPATTVLDLFFAEHELPPLTHDEWRAARAAWREHAREYRRAAKISSSTLPAIGLAAQHAVSARDHAQAALDAMQSMTSGPQGPPTLTGDGGGEREG